MQHAFFGNMTRLDSVKHCISQRDNSQALEGSTALHTGQASQQICDNRREVATYFGANAAFVSALQVHGKRVHIIREAQDRGWMSLDRTLEADAMVTDVPRVVLTIQTADCVPILIYDPIHQVIGAAHAGWRGTQQAILSEALTTMQAHYGTRPDDLVVGIGPSARGCCYEIGAEVAKYFLGYPQALIDKGEGKFFLDVTQVNVMQLVELGVPQTQIEINPTCTICDHEHFFSHRASAGAPGRFMSCIMLE